MSENRSVVNGKKLCTSCKETKPVEEFGRRGGQTKFAHHVKSRCKICERDQSRKYKREKALADPLASRRYWLQFKYGLTLEDYDRMLEEQNGVCAICSNKETYIDSRLGTIRPLVVDHCHETGKIRGLLCDACNKSLGHIKDNQDSIIKSLIYLQRTELIAEAAENLKFSLIDLTRYSNFQQLFAEIAVVYGYILETESKHR